jgi:tetratricopeptide (TPR) repeat protein
MKTDVCRFWQGFIIAAVLVFSGCSGKPSALGREVSGTYSNLLNDEAEELVRTGVSYHDRGDYKTAIDYYNRAMELAPDHPVIYYETGFSRIALGDLAEALELAEKGINAAKTREYEEMIPSLLDLKGSALYNLGRSEESVDVYLLAINQYGVTSVFPYYNLGLNYYRLERGEDAVDALRRGLLINPNHASSNYLLGKICMEDGKKTQAFFPFCYFLLLEPNTERALQSYNTVKHLLSVQEEGIGVRNNGTFTTSDMIISVAFTLDEANFRMSEAEKTKAKLDYVFIALEEQKNSGKIGRSSGDELWWDFYSPFFYRVVKSEHANTFYRYIGLSADPNVDSWIENGQDEIENFFIWLNDYFE